MGDLSDGSLEWPDDDDIDWVRLYMVRPGLWYSLLEELEAKPEPAAVARFVEKCITSLRCVRDFHDQLADIGLTLSRFADLYERAWEAQIRAVDHDDRPVGDNETRRERSSSHRAGWRPDLNDALAPEMRAAIIHLHLRGVDGDRMACVLGVPPDWPEKVVERARLNPRARRVVRAHLDGNSLAAISKGTGVPASSVIRILRQIEETPNGTRARVDARQRARTIIQLRSKGCSYKEIAERVGCSMDVVKNVLRRDRRRRYSDRGPAG